NLKRAVDIDKLFQVPAETAFTTKWLLLQAYEAVGRREQAIQIGEEVLADKSLPREAHCPAAAATATLWLHQGDPRRALRELDRWLAAQPGVYAPDFLPLLVDRARIHAALKQWPEADKDLADYFRHMPADRAVWYPSAYVMQGLLREERGDSAGALEAWRQG